MGPELTDAGVLAFLLLAGVVGGICSSSGAIGSLVSYPALLAVGIPPVAANVTNAVSVTGVGIGASLRSRTEQGGTRERVVRWAVVSALGALAGATVLLVTPGQVFAWVVPFLIAAAGILMLVQPRIDAARVARGATTGAGAFPFALFAVTFYEGYFGAGAGVMTLALVLLTVEKAFPRANALKNLLLGVADVAAAVLFALLGPVHWPAAVALGIGFLAGGMAGPSVVRRMPSSMLRAVIAVASLVLAAWLLVDAIRG